MRARSADIDQLLALLAEFYAEAGYRCDPASLARARDALVRLVADASLGSAWLIRAGAECAGYLVVTLGFSIEYGGRDAFVDELYVRPRHRRRGLGARALQRAASFCRRAGVQALHLEVERANPVAARLYERAGFTGKDRRLLTLTIGRHDGGADRER